MSKIITKKQLNLVIEATLKENGYMTEDESCPECGANVCECGTSYMGEELHGDQKKLDKNKNSKIDSDDFAILRGEKDATEESVKDLAESVKKTFDSNLLTEDMENFNKLINYRNK